MTFDTDRVRSARCAAEPRRFGVGRIARDVDRATFSKSPATARACSGMRVGPSTQPDYGLVVGRTKACTVAQGESGALERSPPATSTLEITSTPLRFRLLLRGAPIVGIDHRRAFPRLDEAARVRPRAPGRALDRGARTRFGRARVWPRREIRPAQQARAAHPFAGRRCARRQHRPRLQECAVRVEPGHAARAPGGYSSTPRRRSRTASDIPTGRTART